MTPSWRCISTTVALLDKTSFPFPQHTRMHALTCIAANASGSWIPCFLAVMADAIQSPFSHWMYFILNMPSQAISHCYIAGNLLHPFNDLLSLMCRWLWQCQVSTKRTLAAAPTARTCSQHTCICCCTQVRHKAACESSVVPCQQDSVAECVLQRHAMSATQHHCKLRSGSVIAWSVWTSYCASGAQALQHPELFHLYCDNLQPLAAGRLVS